MLAYGKAVVVALAAAAGVAAFVATPDKARQPRRGQRGPLARWLQLSPEKAEAVRRADADFERDADLLTDNLRSEREKLAALLDDPKTPAQQILAQVDRVIAAHSDVAKEIGKLYKGIRGARNWDD